MRQSEGTADSEPPILDRNDSFAVLSRVAGGGKKMRRVRNASM